MIDRNGAFTPSNAHTVNRTLALRHTLSSAFLWLLQQYRGNGAQKKNWKQQNLDHNNKIICFSQHTRAGYRRPIDFAPIRIVLITPPPRRRHQ